MSRKTWVALALASLALPPFVLSAFASSLALRSSQFSEGSALPQSTVYAGFGCTGNNQSPELMWGGEPAGTKSFVITVFDPDAPTGVGWWHWLVFNIPATAHVLPQNAGTPAGDKLPPGSQQGYTDFGSSGYGGPCPPAGDTPHRYVFTAYALDVDRLPTGAETTGAKLSFLMKGHILAKVNLTGRFGR
jgi:Raf kinase inhibitor-like YbhB/YbcL family protein